MGNDLRSALRPSLVMLLLFTLLTGLAYPALLTGIAQAIFPSQANGSLVRDGDTVVGSELIGQAFAAPKYFHGRPSAAGKGYDPTASGGSNLGPAAKGLIDRVSGDLKIVRADGLTGDVPADMVTASASGLDPDISPANAYAQVARVARARGIAEGTVKAMVAAAVQEPLAGVLGERRVNVLLLNVGSTVRLSSIDNPAARAQTRQRDRSRSPRARSLSRRRARRGARASSRCFSVPLPGSARPTRCCRTPPSACAKGPTSSSGWSRRTAAPRPRRWFGPFALVPRRVVDFGGRMLTEMDLDALLARRPGLALVDELAHTNLPGSRHPKRYMDIDELLAAGIDVFTTVNIQHIESLNDTVASFTRVRVRETVPDRVLEDAEIEVVDLPPDELIARLQAGKVYVPEEASRALGHFFSRSNLTALRELALRRAAQAIDARDAERTPRPVARRALCGRRARARRGQRAAERARAGPRGEAPGRRARRALDGAPCRDAAQRSARPGRPPAARRRAGAGIEPRGRYRDGPRRAASPTG